MDQDVYKESTEEKSEDTPMQRNSEVMERIGMPEEARSCEADQPANMAPVDLQDLKILFVAYFYPPVFGAGLPGAMRTVKFVRNLDNGEKHVLTTSESKAVAGLPSSLGHLSLPINNESIHRAGQLDIFGAALRLRKRLKSILHSKGSASPPSSGHEEGKRDQFKSASDDVDTRNRFQKLKDFIYDLFYFPDQAGPWIIPAVIRGRRLVRRHDIDVIFATGSPWSGLITGYLISRLTGKPLIADFRDPWMNNPFHQSKGRLLDNWASRLEKKVVQHARWVSLNTDALHEEFLQRYPQLDPKRFVVMPNGFDRNDFTGFESKPDSTGESEKPDGWITLMHAGFLYGPRDPKSLLLAIRAANQADVNAARKIRFVQIGQVSLSYAVEQEFADLLEEGSLVLEPQMPYQACLERMAGADVLVNVQPGTKTQVPSKLYDYLALNRPILNITPADGALGHMVKRYGFGELFEFSETDKLTEHLKELRMQPDEGRKEYPLRDEFDVRSITARMVDYCRDAIKHDGR